MINLTDRIVVINSDRDDLDSRIRSALKSVFAILDERFDSTTARSGEAKSFERTFHDGNLLSADLNQGFLEALFDYSQTDSRSTGIAPIMRQLEAYVREIKVPATALPVLKAGAKLVLVELWRLKQLLLPTIFISGPYFPWSSFSNELLAWVTSVDPVQKDPELKKADPHRLRYFALRLLYATDWSRAEDISLQELTQLHRAYLRYRAGEYPHAIASKIPYLAFAHEAMRQFPGRTNYSPADLASYAVSSELEEAEASSPIGKKTGARSRSEPKPKVAPGSLRLGAESTAVEQPHPLPEDPHESILAAFCLKFGPARPESLNWQQCADLVYPSREHINLAEVSSRWIKTFKAYLRHREVVQGYRSSRETISALNLLLDYLFFYLPWWNELNPQWGIELPPSPRKFTRLAFVSRHDEAATTRMPKTLLEMIKLRRKSVDSQHVAITQLSRFFRFVATQYADDIEIAGANFVNPIDEEFDRMRTRKRYKTAKEVIPGHVYGHLLFFSYEVEKFGQHLQKLALSGGLAGRIEQIRRATLLDPEDFGFKAVVKFRGQELPIRQIPNVFPLYPRTPKNTGESVVVPHLTALRLLITSEETGLRCQSVQWLDERTWDSLNLGVAPEQYVFKLLVNSDKTKTEPWVARAVFRVRALLQREKDFRWQFEDADDFEPVLYEGLEAAPFDPIKPLFRSACGPNPIQDNQYFKYWKRLLLGFDFFFREATGESHFRCCKLGPHLLADGQPLVKQTNRGFAYCALRLETAYSPHSCRATFATNRRDVLDLSDVATLLGQSSDVVAAHYCKPSWEQLVGRLEASDRAVTGDYLLFDAGGKETALRADRPDSALVRNFSQDRKGTIERFGFMPAMALWSTSEEDLEKRDGLELLRSGPMSRIRFRETNICPVGEECPEDIVKIIGAPKRCGICPLAMKCVDHLPAIAAKSNLLVERIRFASIKIARLRSRGEPQAAVNEIWDEMELDVNELLGWRFSEEMLTEIYRKAPTGSGASALHAERPDIIRSHLQRVTKSRSEAEFLLQRLADSNAYPTMATPRIQLLASSMRRRLLAGKDLDEFTIAGGDHDDIEAVSRMLGIMMKAANLSIEGVASQLTSSIEPRPLGLFSLEVEQSDAT